MTGPTRVDIRHWKPDLAPDAKPACRVEVVNDVLTKKHIAIIHVRSDGTTKVSDVERALQASAEEHDLVFVDKVKP